MSSDLPKRIGVALVGIPAAFALVYLGGWVLVALVAVLGAVGTREFLDLSRKTGANPSVVVAVGGAVLAPVMMWGVVDGWITMSSAILAGFIWFLVALSEVVWSYQSGRPAVLNLATSVTAPMYASLLPSTILWLRHGANATDPWVGVVLVFFPLAMTWVCDAFAMFGGSLMGGPKFAPTVSPNKTWSGTLTGLGGAVLISWAFATIVFGWVSVEIPLGVALGCGLAVGVLGQLGDLVESALKRSAGVKDSGTFFPGHGGVMDRLDSLYWVLPVVSVILVRAGVLA